MMHGYFNIRYFGNGGCFGLFHNGWTLIVIGTIVTIAIIFFLWSHNKKKKYTSDLAYETLKMKYVQGDITEEEFLKRKDLIASK